MLQTIHHDGSSSTLQNFLLLHKPNSQVGKNIIRHVAIRFSYSRSLFPAPISCRNGVFPAITLMVQESHGHLLQAFSCGYYIHCSRLIHKELLIVISSFPPLQNPHNGAPILWAFLAVGSLALITLTGPSVTY